MLYGETLALASTAAFEAKIVRKIFFCKFSFSLNIIKLKYR